MKWIVLTDIAGKTHTVNLERVLEIVKGQKDTKLVLANGTDISLAEGELEKLRNAIGKDLAGG